MTNTGFLSSLNNKTVSDKVDICLRNDGTWLVAITAIKIKKIKFRFILCSIFYYIHEFNIAHCILDIYCKQGITNLSVGAFNLVINIAWIRFDWLYDDINDRISSGVCNYRRKKNNEFFLKSIFI